MSAGARRIDHALNDLAERSEELFNDSNGIREESTNLLRVDLNVANRDMNGVRNCLLCILQREKQRLVSE